MGKSRERRFVESMALKDISGKEKWKKLVEFFQTELKKREELVLHQRVRKSAGLEKDTEQKKDSGKKSHNDNGANHLGMSERQEQCSCPICGKIPITF